MEDKRKIVTRFSGKFHEVFGFYPTSTGSYYMDAELVITSKKSTHWSGLLWRPAGRGPQGLWNANNSWYTLLDGGPGTPGFRRSGNIHCPASDAADDIGMSPSRTFRVT